MKLYVTRYYLTAKWRFETWNLLQGSSMVYLRDNMFLSRKQGGGKESSKKEITILTSEKIWWTIIYIFLQKLVGLWGFSVLPKRKYICLSENKSFKYRVIKFYSLFSTSESKYCLFCSWEWFSPATIIFLQLYFLACLIWMIKKGTFYYIFYCSILPLQCF